MDKEKLRCYHCHHKDEYYGMAIIAHTVKEAKKIAWDYHDEFECDWWPDLRARWVKDANIEGLKRGEVDTQINFKEACERKIYTNWDE